MVATTVRLQGNGGVSLAADVWGDEGAPLVLLWHGGGQTRHSWGATAEILADAGWRALSVDLRGHGGSDWSPDGEYGLDQFAGDVLQVVGDLGRPAALVGASLGGIASLVAAGESTGPLCSALVLVDVAPHIESAGRDRIRDFMHEHMEEGFATLDDVADAIAAYNPHRPRPADPSGLRKNLRQGDNGRWYWHWDPRFMQGANDPDESRAVINEVRLDAAARALDVPTLLVRGRSSDLLSMEGAQQFLALAPHAEFVDVEGAGHMIAGDRNDLFNDAVVAFLDRHRPARA